MSTMVWDESGSRYYETGVSRGIFFPIDGSGGVPWNGLVSVSIDPSGGELESYYFDGVKYMDRLGAESFQATIQAVSTPKEFAACEGVQTVQYGMQTHFNKRDKFNMVWRTEIGSDEGEAIGYRLHVAFNCLVQPSARAYATISDTTTPDIRSFVITTTPACGRHSYYTFDSRDGDFTELEAVLLAGNLPKCWELIGLVGPGSGPVSPPSDADCLKTIETFEEYNPGQSIDEDPKTSPDGLVDTYIYGLINNGLDISVLPAEGAFAANDSAASEVGTGAILADDDDATYISSADGDLGYTVGLPPLVGYAEGSKLELHIRMSISGDVNPDDPDNMDADAQVHISTDDTGDVTVGGFSDGTDEGMGFALQAVDGSIVDYVVPLNLDAWINTDIATVVAALNAGAYLNVVGASNNNFDTTPEVRVYEASVVVLNDTEQDKALRVITPDDSSWVEHHIYDAPGGSEVVASNTTEVDFLLKVVPDDSAADGYTQQPARWLMGGSDNDPGKFEIEENVGGKPLFKWFDDSEVDRGFDPLELDTDIWYRLVVDWHWTSVRARVFVRDTMAVVYDETISTSYNPVGFVQHYAGMIH